MSTTVGFEHNIADVIEDIDDVQEDLHDNVEATINSSIDRLNIAVKTYISRDAEVNGNLKRAVSKFTSDRGERYRGVVRVRSSQAPYAPIVEFGSGRRTDVGWSTSAKVPPPSPSSQPIAYPYSAPDIDNISGFAYYIEEWMRDKGLQPRFGSYRASALAISKTIDNMGTYAHPYLRPAWFDEEYTIRLGIRSAVEDSVN